MSKFFHQNNAFVHMTFIATAKIEKLKLVFLPHAAYQPVGLFSLYKLENMVVMGTPWDVDFGNFDDFICEYIRECTVPRKENFSGLREESLQGNKQITFKFMFPFVRSGISEATHVHTL